MKPTDWISVKDRLPTLDERVLVCRKLENGSIYVDIAQRCRISKWLHNIDVWIDEDIWVTDGVNKTKEDIIYWQKIVLPKDIAQSDDNDDNTIIDKIFNWLDNVDFDMEYWSTVDGFCKEKFINDLKKVMN